VSDPDQRFKGFEIWSSKTKNGIEGRVFLGDILVYSCKAKSKVDAMRRSRLWISMYGDLYLDDEPDQHN